jgi:shikimate kinase
MREARIRNDLLDACGWGRGIPQHEKGAAAENDHRDDRDEEQKQSIHVKFCKSYATGRRLTLHARDMLGCAYGQVFSSLSMRRARFNDGRETGRAFRMTAAPPFSVPKTIVLVGLMGAGKSSIGRRLAQMLALPFADADTEIEAAAGATVEEIFARDGEAAFRNGERRVLARLLDNPIQVLATGGGAFMDPETRALIHARAISIWLRADLDLLVARVARRNNRPLLKNGDPRSILAQLIEERYPIYAEADLVVDSLDGPPEATLAKILAVLGKFLGARTGVGASS